VRADLTILTIKPGANQGTTADQHAPQCDSDATQDVCRTIGLFRTSLQTLGIGYNQKPGVRGHLTHRASVRRRLSEDAQVYDSPVESQDTYPDVTLAPSRGTESVEYAQSDNSADDDGDDFAGASAEALGDAVVGLAHEGVGLIQTQEDAFYPWNRYNVIGGVVIVGAVFMICCFLLYMCFCRRSRGQQHVKYQSVPVYSTYRRSDVHCGGVNNMAF
jgi:hypothetical protein